MSSLVWIELDKTAPAHNLRELKKGAATGTKFCAVIKSNAYGHGVAEMAKLLDSEADWFGVNSLQEGLELRELGVAKPILLVGHVPLERLAAAVAADLRMTVYNRETIIALGQLEVTLPLIRVHVKVETGTGRQGVLLDELTDFIRLIKEQKNIIIEGVSTHYANIEDTLNHDYAQKQMADFREALTILEREGERPEEIHTACSAATILFPETHFSMLRSGISIYGLWPSRETKQAAQTGNRPLPDLRPVLSWKCKIAQIKQLPAGSYIGYGCTYKTTRETTIAVLPIGYADGYDRSLGNKGHVLIKGKRAPLRGRICMNLIMADITDIPDVKLEEEVVLLGRDGEEEVSADQMAEWAGTINYEIVTRISSFLPRIIT